MDEMTVTLAEGMTEDRSIPHDTRSLLVRASEYLTPVLKRFVLSVFVPWIVARKLPKQSDIPRALIHATLNISVLVFTAYILLSRQSASGTGDNLRLSAIIALFFIFAIVFCPLVTHLLLHMTGHLKHSIKYTFECMCLASSAWLLFFTYYYAWFTAWAWFIVSYVILLKIRHEVHIARAIFAGAFHPVLLAAIVTLIMWAIVQMAPARMMTW